MRDWWARLTRRQREWILVGIGVLGLVLVWVLALRADAYTLYRSSSGDEGARIHVATFDASGPEGYNRANCDIARGLFQNQPGVTVRYWCEKGRYRR